MTLSKTESCGAICKEADSLSIGIAVPFAGVDINLAGGAVKKGAVKKGEVKKGEVTDGAETDGAMKDGAVKDGAVKDGGAIDAVCDGINNLFSNS